MSPFLDLNDSDAHERRVTLKDVVLFKALIPYIKPQWPYLAASIITLPLISLTQVTLPFIVKRAIDGPIAHRQLHNLLEMALLFLGVLLLHYGLRYVQTLLAQITGQRIILALRTNLYNHLQSLPIDFFHNTPIGKLVTRISSDVENISEVFATGGIAIFSDFAVIIGIIIAMFVMNIHLAFSAMLISPLVIVTMEFFRRRSRGAYNKMRVQLAQLNSLIQESLSGIEVIQLLRQENHNTTRFNRVSHDFMKTNIQSIFYDSSFTASVEFLSFITLVFVLGNIVWVHGGQHLGTTVTFGVLVAFLQYIQMLFEPIEEISDKFTIIQSGLASMEKIMELMHVPSPLIDPVSPRPLTRVKGHIRFEDVTFGYDKANPVLKNLSFEIQPGEKVAIIGATGAGKSTLIKLLNRQYDPDSGRILIDDVDIREYALADLRRNIVVVAQEEFLFSRPILENITLTAQHHPAVEALRPIIETVHANQVVDRLPKGLDTILPERGRNLSNGQRQLLIFARALWHDPAILVLDEATSAIDPQTEALVQDALEKSLTGRTGILIAHRLSTIQQVDTLYVLEAGQIVESGSPATLYASNGAYRRYADLYFQAENNTTPSLSG